MLTINAHAGLLDGLKINNKIENGKTKDVYSGVKFHYLDKEDRIQIVKEILRAVEVEYAPLHVKEKRINLDFAKIKAEAMAAEESVASILLNSESRNNPELKAKAADLQARSNMEFLDRMQLLIAKFQDTHFGIQERISRPLIYTGLRLRRVEGKVVLGSVEKKYLGMVSKLSNTDLSALKIGDQILSIDGINVEDKINQLKEYINGSSDEFRDSTAVRSLTIRNILYPTKNYLTIEFKNAGIYKLPFLANISKDQTPRLDALHYLKTVGIQSDASTIGMTFDKNTRQWTDSGLNFEGYSPWTLHNNLKGLTVFNDDSGAPGMRTGYFMKNGRTYGVLQLLTFSTKKLTVGENALPFIDAIRNFILELKENGMPLVLDLRLNGGGNGSFPAQVLSLLLRENEIAGGPTAGYRMTSYIRQIEEPSLYQEIVGEDVSFGITMDDFKDMLDKTLDSRSKHTPMFNYMPIFPDGKVKGFDNKVVALVTADCVSACDKMSSLLKTSQRALIIGTHSNGTGAGYLSNEELNTEWTDSLRIFSTRIPNYLFGMAGDPETRIFGEDSVYDLDLENKPTMADVLYAPTFKDMSRNNIGWLEKAVETIEKMQ
jgi:hypothetical protein